MPPKKGGSEESGCQSANLSQKRRRGKEFKRRESLGKEFLLTRRVVLPLLHLQPPIPESASSRLSPPATGVRDPARAEAADRHPHFDVRDAEAPRTTRAQDIVVRDAEPVGDEQYYRPSGSAYRSHVWQHFKLLAEADEGEQNCRCTHCKHMFTYTGSTTTLIRHIAKKHPAKAPKKTVNLLGFSIFGRKRWKNWCHYPKPSYSS